MSRTYGDELLYDLEIHDSKQLTRDIDKLNWEIDRMRMSSHKNSTDFDQSTPIYPTMSSRQSDSGIGRSRTPKT